jgi:hypothetical protein
MVTTKDGPRPYWVHLIWTVYLFLYITMFWWWEFRLNTVDWSLPLYLVVIIYATLLFFVSLVIQPSTADQITSYKDYYYSHRRWIFSLLVTISLWDFVDTLSKGSSHYLDLGMEHRVGTTLQIIAAAVAFITPNERYHEIYAVAWLLYFVTFMYRTFFVLI